MDPKEKRDKFAERWSEMKRLLGSNNRMSANEILEVSERPDAGYVDAVMDWHNNFCRMKWKYYTSEDLAMTIINELEEDICNLDMEIEKLQNAKALQERTLETVRENMHED